MCGIAGKFNFDPASPIDREQLTAMTAVVTHRGPDADGFYVGAGIGLGHRRLSIIDLSTGDQPLANEDQHHLGDLQRRDLQLRRDPLRARGVRPSFPHAHRHRGHRPRVRAMGRPRGRALPRDVRASRSGTSRAAGCCSCAIALGVKPLYYSLTTSGVTFGSEIKSLLEDPDVPRAWSPEALDAYLALQYVPCPADDVPRTSGSCRRATCSSPSTIASRCAATGI